MSYSSRSINRNLILLVLTPCLLILKPSIASADDGRSADYATSLLLKIRSSNSDSEVTRSVVPLLKDAFLSSSDPYLRENIASSLVIAGQKDEVYWSILAERAGEIVDNQAPYPLLYDADGKSIPGAISLDFIRWAKANNIQKDQALGDQLTSFPSELSFLAITGDPRGLQILRRGLLSPNYGVRAVAALGLAKLNDKASIPQIIEAVRQAPLEAQWPIARHLLAFDDHMAYVAAEELISNKNLLEELRQQMEHKVGQ